VPEAEQYPLSFSLIEENLRVLAESYRLDYASPEGIALR